MRYVALLRGINVGGNRMVKMDALRAIFADLGMREISTYINSGNVLFSTSVKDPVRLTAKIETGLERALGFPMPTMLRNAYEMSHAARQIPREKLQADPALRMYTTFFTGKPSAAAEQAVLGLCNELFEYWLDGRELYTIIRPPGDAIFAATSVEKLIGLRGTARNWKSVVKLAELVNL